MDQKERVKPQKGHGSPVTFKKVHPMRGRDRRGTQNGSTKAEPVSNTNGRCATITSQYESGLDHTGNNDFPFLGLRCPASMVISCRSGFHRFHAPGIKYFPVCYRQNTNLNGECKNDANTAGDGADAPIRLHTMENPKNGQKLRFTMLKLSTEAGQKSIFPSTIRKRPNIKSACPTKTTNREASCPMQGTSPRIRLATKIAIPQMIKNRKLFRKKSNPLRRVPTSGRGSFGRAVERR